MTDPKPRYLVKAEVCRIYSVIINRVLDGLPIVLERRDDHHATVLFAERLGGDEHRALWERSFEGQNLRGLHHGEYAFERAEQRGSAVILLLLKKSGACTLTKRNSDLVYVLNAVETHPKYLPHVTVGYSKEALSKQDLDRLTEAFADVTVSFDQERSKKWVPPKPSPPSV